MILEHLGQALVEENLQTRRRLAQEIFSAHEAGEGVGIAGLGAGTAMFGRRTGHGRTPFEM